MTGPPTLSNDHPIVEQIAGLLIDLGLASGSKLPAERALARALGLTGLSCAPGCSCWRRTG